MPWGERACAAPDNHIAIEARGTRSARTRVNPLAHGARWLASWHRPVFPETGPVLPSARIESLPLVRGRLELRVHRTVGVPPGTPIHHSGWAVATAPEAAVDTGQGAELRLDAAEVSSQLLGLHGWPTRRVVRAPQGTAYGPWAVVPELSGRVGESGAGTVFVALASLTGEPDPAALSGQATAVADGLTVTVDWADGSRTVVDFGADGRDGHSVMDAEPA